MPLRVTLRPEMTELDDKDLSKEETDIANRGGLENGGKFRDQGEEREWEEGEETASERRICEGEACI